MILIVEDDVLIQMLGTEQLEYLGFKAEIAGSATEAMGKLGLHSDIEAVIVDIGLPDRRGDVLVGEIRATCPSMPIIVATGHGEQAVRLRLRDHAQIAFLGKPYVVEQLRATLASLNVG